VVQGRRPHTERAGFFVLFIEEKKRREKIDSPPCFFPEWA
jgi:hypothetical protein